MNKSAISKPGFFVTMGHVILRDLLRLPRRGVGPFLFSQRFILESLGKKFLEELQKVGLVARTGDGFGRDLEIDRSGHDRGMAHHDLDCAKVDAGLKHVSRKTVSERMEGSSFAKASLGKGAPESMMRHADLGWNLACASVKEVLERSILGVVRTKLPEKLGRKHGVTIFGTLTTSHMNHHALRVDVSDLQVTKFTDANSGAIRGHEHRAVFDVL